MISPIYTELDYEALINFGLYYQYVFDRKLTDISHSHDFYEIIYVLKGACTHIINGENIVFSNGQIALLRPGDIHHFSSQTDDIILISLSVTKSQMSKYSSLYYSFSNILQNPVAITTNKHEKNLLDSLIMSTNLVIEKEKINDLIKIQLSFFVQLLVLKSLNYSPKKHPALDKLLLEMSNPENIKDGVDALLRLTNYSHSHLCRLFKEHYNTTPKKYVKTLQMDYAYQLVQNPELSYEQIAEKIGYSSISHFHQVFKQTYNKTASQIRKESIKNTI